jgi:hypothetical protein
MALLTLQIPVFAVPFFNLWGAVLIPGARYFAYLGGTMRGAGVDIKSG